VTEDELRHLLLYRVGSLWVTTGILLKCLDHPQMTIKALRESKIAADFRAHVHGLSQCMIASTQTLAPGEVLPEERKFWDLWFREIEHIETTLGLSARERGGLVEPPRHQDRQEFPAED